MTSTAYVYGFDIQPPTGYPLLSNGKIPGDMLPGTYSYKVTYVTSYGETLAGPSTSTTITKTSVSVSMLPLHPTNNTIAIRIYRTGVANALPYRFVAEVKDAASTVYIDTAADADLGVEEPFEPFGSSIGRELGYVAKSKPNIISTQRIIPTGADQATAARLSAEYTEVDVGPGTGVKLPPITANLIGITIKIKNSSGTILNIYPSNPVHLIGGDLSITVATDFVLSLICDSATTWADIGTSGSGVVPGTAVETFSAGTTGLLPNTPTTGSITLSGVLNVASGGTGATSYPAGSVLYGGPTVLESTNGTPGQLLVSGGTATPTWSNVIYDGTTITDVPDPVNPLDIANLQSIVLLNPTVLDEAPTGATGDEKYPRDLSRGVWHGLNTKANSYDSSCVTVGRNATTGAYVAAAGSRSSVAIGSGATATGVQAIAIGTSATAAFTNSVAVGTGASPGGTSAICIGTNATSDGANHIVIGDGSSVTTSIGCVAIGAATITGSSNSTAIGNCTVTGGGASFAACNSSVSGRGVAIGQCFASGNSFCVGWDDGPLLSRATSESFATGVGASAVTRSIAMGYHTTAVNESIAMIAEATSSNGSIAIGYATVATGFRCVVAGAYSTCAGTYSVVYGPDNSITGSYGVVVGSGNNVGTGTQNIVIGTSSGSALLTGVRNIVLGENASTDGISADDCIAIGANALQSTVASTNIAIGADALRSADGVRQEVTASQTATTISSAMFTQGMEGGIIVWAGTRAPLTTYVDPDFTSTVSQTQALEPATVYYGTATTGSATLLGGTVNGGGFTTDMIGGYILFDGIAPTRIIANPSTTVLTVEDTVTTLASTPYTIYSARGTNNTAIGEGAGEYITSGSNNFCVGWQAGKSLEVGSGNVIIGAGADVLSNTTDCTVIGSGIIGNVNGGLFLKHNTSASGNPAAWLAGPGPGGGELVEVTSSIRYKDNVRDIESVSAKVSKLRPVYFNAKPGFGDPTKDQIGFIAEEVNLLFPEIVNKRKIDGVSVPDGLQYDRIAALLVKDRQEINARIVQLKARLDAAGIK
jgi:hypothetical protein